jgi:hypothetical protein
MDIALITSTAISILSHYGPELTKMAGDAAVQAAKQIYSAIKQHFAQNDKGKQTLDLYEQDPKTFESALKSILQQQFEQNQAFTQQIQELIESFEKVAPSETVSQIRLQGSGAIATNGSVAAGQGGYASGGDMHVGTPPEKKD